MTGLFVRALVTILLGAVLSGTLVRFAPGFDVDERQLNPQLRQESIDAIARERAREGDLLSYYANFLKGYWTGDLGESRVLGQPVAELIAARGGSTLQVAGGGWAIAWALGLSAAVAAYFHPVGRVLLTGLNATFLSIPVALLALALLLSGSGSLGAGAAVVGLAVFPKIAEYLHRMFTRAAAAPHVLPAHARGVSPGAVFVRHVMGSCAAEMAALAGVSIAFALSAAIPAEVILDIAGLGQLAWQAALGRDLNLLVHLTMLMTAVIAGANALAEWPSARRRAA